ncbi:MAG: LysM peptidoglycan-binding domain-containing M23 family metallopeptidase [Rhodospirillales bacterium]|nr:LysM peptidoglycan-binding domain-containing M23 family metallopeptidase [Rhodospirillales bacterium]
MLRSTLLTCLLFITACAQTPAPLSNYGAGAGAGSAGMHTVATGDTVYSISRRYKIEMPEIITVNHLSAPFRLHVGQRLKLPPPQTYEVRNGDSLYSISRLFNISQTQLAQSNILTPPYMILPGQILTIPGSTAALSAPASSPLPAEKIEVAAVSRQVIAPPPAQTASPAQAPAADKITSPPPLAASATPSRHGFIRPVKGQVISAYGPKGNGLHNDGINIAAARGTPVQAVSDGTVVYAGSGLKGYGNLVLIKHQNRYLSAYGHLEKITIKKGDTIRIGQSIGTVGTSGQVKTPQLHFEIRKGTEAIDPEKVI